MTDKSAGGSEHVGPIVFSDSTARGQLLNHGQVVTFRKDERTTGDTWWRESRTGEKMGDCRVRKIGHVNPSDDSHLRVFQPHSGFRSVESWQDAIGRLNDGEMPEDGVLYHVEAVEDECGKCGEVGYLPTNTFCPPCSREEAVRPDGGTEQTGTERSRLVRRLIETVAHGARGQLNEDEEHAETRCRYCGEGHLGELYESPPEGFYVRYYCPNTNSKGRRSFP